MEKERSGGEIRHYEADIGGLTMVKGTMELKIFNLEDRLKVAEILIKNGYTVSQKKRQRNPTGKTLEYYLAVTEDQDNAESVK